jgi:hypothetical protein
MAKHFRRARGGGSVCFKPGEELLGLAGRRRVQARRPGPVRRGPCPDSGRGDQEEKGGGADGPASRRGQTHRWRLPRPVADRDEAERPAGDVGQLRTRCTPTPGPEHRRYPVHPVRRRGREPDVREARPKQH